MREQDRHARLDRCISQAAIPEKGGCLQTQDTKLSGKPTEDQDTDAFFPLQVWVTGDLDSNLGFASASLKGVERLIVVMVIKIKLTTIIIT